MLQLTPKAANHLIDARRKRGVDASAGARFVSKGGRVGLTFASAPEAGDKILKGEQINIYVAADIADVLDTSTIDARDENGEMSLIIRRRAKAATNGQPTN